MGGRAEGGKDGTGKGFKKFWETNPAPGPSVASGGVGGGGGRHGLGKWWESEYANMHVGNNQISVISVRSHLALYSWLLCFSFWAHKLNLRVCNITRPRC